MPPSRNSSGAAALCLLAALLLTPLLFAADEHLTALADGEADFVQQQIDQGLFELAAQYCERQSSFATVPDEQADWEVLLGNCRLRQVWSLSADSRSDTIRLAIQRLSDFRNQTAPSSEKDLQLRLCQLELLSVAGSIEEVLLTNFSARPGQRLLQRSGQRDSLEFAVKAVEQGQVEADALLKQVDSIRRDLDPSFARLIRDRIRMLSAQMLVSQLCLKPSADVVEQQRKVRALAEQILKSTPDERLIFQARALIAEMSLELDSPDQMALKLRTLEDAAVSDSEQIVVESLRVRTLLNQQRPSDALEVSFRGSKQLFDRSSELQLLRLQSMLSMYEILYELQSDQTRERLKKTTAEEFKQQRDRLMPRLVGVWKERGYHICVRFERVQQLGPVLATSFEEISALLESGDTDNAARQLDLLIQQLRSDQPELRAAVLLQKGQLSVRQKKWQNAEQELLEARQGFVQSGNSAEAAAADLLRVFAIGQQWDEAIRSLSSADLLSEGNDAVKPASIQETSYRMALEEHLQTFKQERSIATARQWRAKLLRATAPLESAAEYLQAARRPIGESPGLTRLDSTELLGLAADCLIDVIATNLPMTKDEDQQFTSLYAELKSEASAMGPGRESMNLEARLLAISVRTPSGELSVWTDRLQKAEAILSTLATPSAAIRVTDPLPGSTSRQDPLSPQQAQPSGKIPEETTGESGLVARSRLLCQTVKIASVFRRLDDPGLLKEASAALKDVNHAERFQMISLLIAQMQNPSGLIPGDSQMAAFISPLVRIASVEGPTPVPIQIQQLQLLQQLAAVSGDWTFFELDLAQLIQQSLSDANVLQIAAVFQDQTSAIRTDRRSEKSTVDFWRFVQRRMKRGQDLWLEASFQLAYAAFDKGDEKEARRVLGVVKALYPDWGNAERRQRVEQLQTQLQGDRELNR